MAKKTLEQVRVKALIRQVQSNDSALGAIITYLACISILFAIYFYPVYLIPFLALIPALLSYKFHPGIGLTATWLIALPAFAFQSAVFAWVGSIFLIVVLYTAADHWATISLATIAVFLPFAPFPLSFLGGFIYLVLLVGGMYLGSKESMPFTVTTVLLILLASATWNVPNSAHFPLNPASNFQTNDYLLRATDIPFYYSDFLPAYSKAISNLVNFGAAMNFGNTLGVLWHNLMVICFGDTGLMQALSWMAVIWSAVYFTGRPLVRLPMMLHKKVEMSFLFLLLIPVIYTIFYALDNSPYLIEMPIYAVASILVAQWMMNNKIMTFKELEIRSHETEKKFGTTAVQEMSLSTDVQSMEDFANYEETKKEIYNSIVIPLQKPEISIAYNINPPKGILLFGPPGTGKTFLMKALSKKLDYNMLYIKTSDLLSSLYGESEKNVSKIFQNAKKTAPCILFFDEIDAIGKKRSSEDYVTSRVLDTLLVEMDNTMSKPGKPVIFVAATNVPQLIDRAFMRPGRIDKIIYMPLPDRHGREEIFKVKLKGLPIADDVDPGKLADETDRFSGADITLAVQEAKGRVVDNLTEKLTEDQPAKGEIELITMDDLLSAAKSIKPSTSFSDLEAYEKFQYDFERKRKKETKKEEGAIDFKDVVGMDDVKETLKQSLELPIKHPELIKEYRIEVPKGILLFGPPGTGKTYLAKAAAGEFKIPILLVSGADLMKKGPSAAAEELKTIFNRARENPPAIVFIDELETVAPLRGSSDIIVGQLLQEMDGLAKNRNIMVIGATNMPHMVDTALLRPGRFDKIIYVSPSDLAARKDLFKMYMAPFEKGLDLAALAKSSDGFSAADVKSVCSEVKIDAAKEKIRGMGQPSITTEKVMAKLVSRRPSITQNMLREFERFMQEYGERR
jgi:transitional endoplasmic reticulum ATPase